MTKAERRQLERIQGSGTACAVNLAAYLKSKTPRRKPISSRKIEKKAKALSKKGRWEAVKEAVARRAAGICECGCGFLLAGDWWRPGGDADHFYGKHRETVEKVWQLSRLCHNAKGENRPSREHWDRLFLRHCTKHGYSFRPRAVKEQHERA